MRIYIFIFLLSLFVPKSWANNHDQDVNDPVNSELERLSGFKQHRQDEKIFDEEREKGKTAYYEQLEQESLQYQKDLEEYRKNKKKHIEPERTKDYSDHIAEKKSDFLEHEELEFKYAKRTNEVRNKLSHRILSEEEELGLVAKTDRVDYKKRVLYGAKPNFKAVGKSGSGGSGYSVPSGGGSPSGPSGFPQPDFSSDTGFIPPPPMPDPFDPGVDFPPPPPPDFPDMDFPPPPPPPPPPGDFGDF